MRIVNLNGTGSGKIFKIISRFLTLVFLNNLTAKKNLHTSASRRLALFSPLE
jgi:hypothetical protein